MKMSRQERKLYNLGKQDGYLNGYLDGYKDGLYDGNPFNALFDNMIKAINDIGKALSDPAIIKALEEAKKLKEASEDNELGEEAGDNENEKIDS